MSPHALQANEAFNHVSLIQFQGCRAILFDFGGTLDSDGEHWLDRFHRLYSEAGIDVSTAEIKRAFYHADNQCYGDAQVSSMGLRALMNHHIHLQFVSLGLDREKERCLVDGFCGRAEWFFRRNAPLLSCLKERYRLGLVSNFYGNVDVLCREAGLLDSLDVVLDSARLGISKPDAGIFRIALERLGVSAEAAVFVGDSYERDMIPSSELGMKTIWLKGPNPRIPEGARPVDAWITDLTKLEALLP